MDAAFARAATVVRATYEWPTQNHAMIGPSCAVADVRPGHVTVWSCSQWIQQTRRDLARMLDVPIDDVRVIWKDGSGTYGRMACDDAAADAAVLSRAVNRPVRVQWTRQEEHGWEPKSPAMVMDLRAAVDAQRHVLGFELETWSPSHSTAEVGNFLAWRLMGGHPGWDRLSGGEGEHAYRFDHNRMIGHYVEEVLRAVYLRSPGGVQHTFAIESFIDELAAEAGADPLQFRLRYLDDERAIRLLRAVAERARWQTQTPRRAPRATSGLVSGRGICFAPGQAAAVADVDVNLDTGAIRVTRAFVSARCGRIVNPEGMRHQVEGAFLQGLSRTLFEEVTFQDGRVTSLDWRTYPILRSGYRVISVSVKLAMSSGPHSDAEHCTSETPALETGRKAHASDKERQEPREGYDREKHQNWSQSRSIARMNQYGERSSQHDRSPHGAKDEHKRVKAR